MFGALQNTIAKEWNLHKKSHFNETFITESCNNLPVYTLQVSVHILEAFVYFIAAFCLCGRKFILLSDFDPSLYLQYATVYENNLSSDSKDEFGIISENPIIKVFKLFKMKY